LRLTQKLGKLAVFVQALITFPRWSMVTRRTPVTSTRHLTFTMRRLMNRLIIPAVIIISILSIFSSASAIQLKGEGYGCTEKEAKKEAVADLSSAIEAEVKTSFQTMIKTYGDEVEKCAKKVINIRSELPILGAEYELEPMQEEILATALLDSRNVIALYEEKLRDIKKEIKSSLKNLQNPGPAYAKYTELMHLQTELDQFYKHKTVAMLLGSSNIPLLNITESDIRNRLQSLENSVDSIKMGARLISKGITEKKIFIHPPTTKCSNEITQFAGIVKDRLSVCLNTVQSPKNADYSIIGNYEILKQGIELTCRLVDGSFNTLKTRVVKLLPESYKDYEIEPKTVSFDRLLHEGIVVSNNFRVEISTNKGKKNLLFKNKEELELLVKSNRSCHFYIVGHIIKSKEKYSYLVEIQDVPGKRRFVYYLNADDINRWVSLGKFETTAPLGVESIQLIASNKDLKDSLPKCRYDKNTGLCLISTDPEKGVIKTRGLKPVYDKKNKVISAEAALMFTTMKAGN